MLKITISNKYAPKLVETYCCFHVDMSNKEEIDYCIEETIGAYMDSYECHLLAAAPKKTFEELLEGISYIAEEVSE